MEKNANIKSLLVCERPYEKCERYGVKSLTDIELLAVILRSGTKGKSSVDLARQILYSISPEKGLLSLHYWTKEQLIQLKGMGRVKSLQILCLSEMSTRLSKASALQNLCFTCPGSIAKYYMEDLRHKQQEHLKMIMLNTKNRLLGESDISKGTVNASLISPRELFVEALQKNAVSIILLHNHPSGDPNPSKEDILVTKRIKEAGILIGIELLDHLIIGNNCYSSLAEKGLL